MRSKAPSGPDALPAGAPPAETPSQPLVRVGRILGPWGSKGFLRVEALSDNPERFALGSRILVSGQPCAIERRARAHGQTILKLAGVDTPEAARLLAGASLEVPAGELGPLPEGVHYHYHLLGMRVVTEQGEHLGEIAEIIATGANDVYVVRHGKRDLLLPAIADVIKRVDTARNEMTVALLPGLR